MILLPRVGGCSAHLAALACMSERLAASPTKLQRLPSIKSAERRQPGLVFQKGIECCLAKQLKLIFPLETRPFSAIAAILLNGDEMQTRNKKATNWTISYES